MKSDDLILICEENKQLDARIQSILKETAYDRKKWKKLCELRDSAKTSLGRSHVTYYMEAIQARKRERYGFLISALIIGAWLVWVLYRIYLYLHPETCNIVSILGITADQSIYVLFLLPVAILVYYIVIYRISSKNSAGSAR